MAAAVALPRLLEQVADRTAMLWGAVIMTSVLVAGSVLATSYVVLLVLWAIMGVGYSLTLTPAGRALRRSSNAQDRPALFAAQFALSHAAWLIAYPVAGLVSAQADPSAAFLVLAALCATGTVLGFVVWPANDPADLPHRHDALPIDDAHLSGSTDETVHAHPFVIDERHPRWPRTRERESEP